MCCYSSVKDPAAAAPGSLPFPKCQIGGEGKKGEHEQTEKHINPKLCAEIERTCAHLLLQQGGGIVWSKTFHFSSSVQ